MILEPLLIPFTLECNKKRALAGQLPMIVQEDKAPSNNSKYQEEVFSLHEILRLLWPGNSLDLNMIESCWAWIKRKTYKIGPPKTREEMIKQWKEEWKIFPPSKLQDFVACMPRHLRIIRFLRGDNKY